MKLENLVKMKRDVLCYATIKGKKLTSKPVSEEYVTVFKPSNEDKEELTNYFLSQIEEGKQDDIDILKLIERMLVELTDIEFPQDQNEVKKIIRKAMLDPEPALEIVLNCLKDMLEQFVDEIENNTEKQIEAKNKRDKAQQKKKEEEIKERERLEEIEYLKRKLKFLQEHAEDEE